MKEKTLVIFAGVRTPFARSGGALKERQAEDLGVLAVRELLDRTGVDPARLDGLIAGNVGQSSRAANIARVMALRADLPESLPAWTVHRNCASGFEAVTEASEKLAAGHGILFLAVGTESMSNYPLEFNQEARGFFERLAKARSPGQKLKALAAFRPGMMKPKVALLEGLKDPVVGLGMGETSELLAREWGISRKEQDAFARRSHQLARDAREHLAEEIFPVPHGGGLLQADNGVREEAQLERLGQLRTVFQARHGSVTAGNSSQITDGAAALLVGSREAGEALGLPVLGELEAFAYAGCDPRRMGLGPVFAIHKLYPDVANPLESFDLFEINEAFAAQVIACERAAADSEWCRKHLGRMTPLGSFQRDKLNVNGGAIALGHPVGATGARLVLTALKELRRRGQSRALVSLCVGGGQGGALALHALS